jgi:lysozyme
VAGPRLLADLQKAEGCRLVAYRDTRGFWTIGYGHLLDQSIDWAGHTITQDTADQLLALDVDEKTTDAQTLPEWSQLDTPCRQNAVIELVFNMGLHTWTTFKLTRAAIQAQDWQAAHDNLLIGPWQSEVGPARSQRLAGYLLRGSYSP